MNNAVNEKYEPCCVSKNMNIKYEVGRVILVLFGYFFIYGTIHILIHTNSKTLKPSVFKGGIQI